MPTIGRLTGAICFGALGVYLASLTSVLFDDGTMPWYWTLLCGASGVWSGWFFVGKRVGNGLGGAVGNGITGALALAFWALFVLSFVEMITRSMRRTYDGPLEAIVGIFELMVQYAVQFGISEVITTALIGGIVCGLITEFMGRRFP